MSKKNLRILSFFLFLHVGLFGNSYTPKYIWSLGFAIAADQSPFKKGLPYNYGSVSHMDFVHPKKYVERKGKNGSIIWIQRVHLPFFYEKILPYMRYRFVLIINDGDESFPNVWRQPWTVNLLNDSRVIAVFAQNVDGSFEHPKIHYLPIGLDYHSVARKDGYFGEKYHSVELQEHILSDIVAILRPTSERKKRVLLDFGPNDFNGFGESRTEVIQQLSPLPFVDLLPSTRRHSSWGIKGEYAFAVSPHGYGLDCHRTWEGLILGNIVIVKTSPIDSLYEGLPVVIVQDWSEITEANLDLWLEKYGDAHTNPAYQEKLTHKYWMDKIKAAAILK